MTSLDQWDTPWALCPFEGQHASHLRQRLLDQIVAVLLQILSDEAGNVSTVGVKDTYAKVSELTPQWFHWPSAERHT